MMWQQFIVNLGDHCKTHPPLTEEWIDKGLFDLGVTLNADLKSFLLETDGLYDYKQFLWMVWTVRDLAAYNIEMRNHQEFADKGYNFEDIFFISNSGKDGILFGLPIVNNIIQACIIAWYPTTDERVLVSDSLEDYVTKWIAKTLFS